MLLKVFDENRKTMAVANKMFVNDHNERCQILHFSMEGHFSSGYGQQKRTLISLYVIHVCKLSEKIRHEPQCIQITQPYCQSLQF